MQVILERNAGHPMKHKIRELVETSLAANQQKSQKDAQQDKRD
jgi:hypothetical protein